MVCAIGTAIGFLTLAWQFRSLVALLTAVTVTLVVLPAIRMAGKRDPMMFAVYARYRVYRGHYPARSTPYRKH